TLFTNCVRLNLGRIEVLSIRPKGLIEVTADAESLPNFPLELAVEVHKPNGNEPSDGVFKTVPGSAACFFFEKQTELVLPQLYGSHAKLLEKAAQTSRNPMTEKAHSSGVIEYLKDYLGQPLPQPMYFNSSKGTNIQMQFELSQTDEAEELPDIEQEIISAIEGRKNFITHLRRERNSRIIKAKKNQVLNETGRLDCEACSFDFEKKYGELGENFAEAHHRALLSAVETEIETTLDDLSILCSNCHRMIHKTEPMESIAEFRERLARLNMNEARND
nr:HNH endonuclease [Acidobacteriota bacterium]